MGVGGDGGGRPREVTVYRPINHRLFCIVNLTVEMYMCACVCVCVCICVCVME